MFALLCFVLAVLASPFELKSRLEAENVALRHQLIVLRRKVQGWVRLTNNDRWFFIQLYRWFPSILQVLTIIRPKTLVRWHRTVPDWRFSWFLSEREPYSPRHRDPGENLRNGAIGSILGGDRPFGYPQLGLSKNWPSTSCQVVCPLPVSQPLPIIMENMTSRGFANRRFSPVPCRDFRRSPVAGAGAPRSEAT